MTPHKQRGEGLRQREGGPVRNGDLMGVAEVPLSILCDNSEDRMGLGTQHQLSHPPDWTPQKQQG